MYNSGYNLGSNLRNSNPRSQIVNGRPITFQRPTRQIQPTRRRPSLSHSGNIQHVSQDESIISNQELLESIQEFQENIQKSVETIRNDVLDLKTKLSNQSVIEEEDTTNSTPSTLSNQEMLYYQNALQQANYTVASIAQSAIASLQRGQTGTTDSVYPTYTNNHSQNSSNQYWNSMYPQYYNTDSSNLDQGSHNIQQAYAHYRDATAQQATHVNSDQTDPIQSIEDIIDSTIMKTQLESPTNTES